MKRNATAIWQGGGKEGKGTLTTQSRILTEVPYSAFSRFDKGMDTNPEELIAAAHAGCFTMKLAFNLEAAGIIPQRLETKCIITLESGTITSSHLTLKAVIPGASREKFDEAVSEAEKNCPVSKLLNTEIKVEAGLEN